MTDHLTRADLAHLNERTIRAHGGTFTAPENLADEAALTTLLDTVASDDLSRLADKAAAYFYGIINIRVFQDANGRTALLAARTFVLLNGGIFHKKLKAVEVDERRIPAEGNGREIWFSMTTETSHNHLSPDDCRAWFAANLTAPVHRSR